MTVTETTRLAPNVTAMLLRELEGRTSVPREGREIIEVVAPFDLRVIGAVPQATEQDIRNAGLAARSAQPAWEALGPRRRARILLRFHDLLLAHVDEVTDLIQLEGGKARMDAWREVVDTIGVTRFVANMTPKVTRRRRHQGAMPIFTKTYEFRHAKGLVGFISPWNYPFTLAISDAIAALATGNAVLLKPDEKTPYSALLGARLLEEAGVPPALVQVVTGAGAPIGEAIVDQVDFIMFTGSTEVGRLIAEMAGRRLIACSMELGGKNAAIVLPDADLGRTVRELAAGSFANGGQTCVSMERIYVHESVREEFTRRFVEYSASVPMAPAFDFSSDLSSLIDQAQLEQVHAHVEDAVAKGATLLTGGKPRPDVGPLFYAATVLTNVSEDMDLCRSETFGPVTAIYGYTDLNEAIESANSSDFGLHFSVWGRGTDHALDIATRLQAGSVTINDGLVATWGSHEAPMGGMKDSGMGRRHGVEGILKFTEPQAVAVQRLIPAYSPFGAVSAERYTRMVEYLTKVFRRLPFYR
ncbi:MAG TPA: succinic semialdehyde dehydrogenase [Acidimicrobiia bacterium]|nr:succinic semialdehyde dehydrogenase [Acidimicrobiia bacterium]